MAKKEKNHSFDFHGLKITELCWGRDLSLLIFFSHNGESLMIDLGQFNFDGIKPFLSVKNVLITHAHIDHFISFDQLLRMSLGIDNHIVFHGPPDFSEKISSRLGGYSWNLVENSQLSIEAREYDEGGKSIRLVKNNIYHSNQKFVDNHHLNSTWKTKNLQTIHADSAIVIYAQILDHHIPVLGFRLEKPPQLKIDVKGLYKLGLKPGPWLNKLQFSDKIPQSFSWDNFSLNKEELSLFLTEKKPSSIAFITDTIYSEKTAEKIHLLAKDADYLYCGTPYLDKDREKATKNRHLTARQGGEIAKKTNAKNLVLFHLSPIYKGDHKAFIKEAQEYSGGKCSVRIAGDFREYQNIQ